MQIKLALCCKSCIESKDCQASFVTLHSLSDRLTLFEIIVDISIHCTLDFSKKIPKIKHSIPDSIESGRLGTDLQAGLTLYCTVQYRYTIITA